MNSFLHRFAKTFYEHHSSDINDFIFVFPNRRAGLFFQKYLAEIAGKPIFAPQITTINNCFSMASSLKSADRIILLFKLYQIYLKQSKSEESFDTFIFWGEMLLSDFNDIDTYQVDAQQLFTNISDLKQIDQLFNIFSDKQIEAIKEFWNNFVPIVEGKSQEDFISTWRILHPIYIEFRNELINEGLATNGMICREVSERLLRKESIPEYDNKQFVFVGFNALNPCERTLFAELQKAGKADFYWDYEAQELRDSDNPASRYYADNIHVFPSKYTLEPCLNQLKDKEIELIAVPSDVGQVKQVHKILDTLYPNAMPTKKWIDTAIVLPNENLLIPLLHSFPEQIDKINVTMGFPLKATPASGLIDLVFELQKRLRTRENKHSFYHANVSSILNHQYISMLCAKDTKALSKKMASNNWIYIEAEELVLNDLLKAIFDPITEPTKLIDYLLNILKILHISWQKLSSDSITNRIECDFLYQYYITLNRMQELIRDKPLEISMNMDTLVRMTKQVIAGVSVPFVGEPLDGLQVMGVLETRGLDFENLIITSFNEGVYPVKSGSNSFIPYNLRRGFELPTTENQDAITAYNFYRLIHQAKRIFFLYDSRTEGVKTGEVSRYFHQLNYHYGVNCKKKSISYDLRFDTPQSLCIEKTEAVMEKLLKYTIDSENKRAFSASSINSYINCPLQFYLTRIESIKEEEEIVETIESSMFGTIFHAVLEMLYQPYVGKILQSDDFESLINNSLHIDRVISQAFAENYYKKKKGTIMELKGNDLLTARVIRKYVIQVLKTDKKQTPFTYIDSELKCEIRFPIHEGKIAVNIGGTIDRIDEKNGEIRILDYKTGGGETSFKSIVNLFEKNLDKRPSHILQTFLYGLFYKEKALGKPMKPSILHMKSLFKNDFSTSISYKPEAKINEEVNDFSVFEKDFSTELRTCIEEVFNPEIPFSQTENKEICKYCPYTGVCGR